MKIFTYNTQLLFAYILHVDCMMSLLLSVWGFSWRSAYSHFSFIVWTPWWECDGVGCEGLRTGGRVIPTPETRQIIERKACGIFPRMSFFILLSCCFLALSMSLLSFSFSHLLISVTISLRVSRQCRSDMLKENSTQCFLRIRHARSRYLRKEEWIKESRYL